MFWGEICPLRFVSEVTAALEVELGPRTGPDERNRRVRYQKAVGRDVSDVQRTTKVRNCSSPDSWSIWESGSREGQEFRD